MEAAGPSLRREALRRSRWRPVLRRSSPRPPRRQPPRCGGSRIRIANAARQGHGAGKRIGRFPAPGKPLVDAAIGLDGRDPVGLAARPGPQLLSRPCQKRGGFPRPRSFRGRREGAVQLANDELPRVAPPLPAGVGSQPLEVELCFLQPPRLQRRRGRPALGGDGPWAMASGRRLALSRGGGSGEQDTGERASDARRHGATVAQQIARSIFRTTAPITGPPPRRAGDRVARAWWQAIRA